MVTWRPVVAEEREEEERKVERVTTIDSLLRIQKMREEAVPLSLQMKGKGGDEGRGGVSEGENVSHGGEGLMEGEKRHAEGGVMDGKHLCGTSSVVEQQQQQRAVSEGAGRGRKGRGFHTDVSEAELLGEAVSEGVGDEWRGGGRSLLAVSEAELLQQRLELVEAEMKRVWADVNALKVSQ